jgi:hypothetical protein
VEGKCPEAAEGTHHGVDDHGPEGEEGTHRVEVGKGMSEMDDTLKSICTEKTAIRYATILTKDLEKNPELKFCRSIEAR